MKRYFGLMLVLTIVFTFMATGFAATPEPFIGEGYTPVSEQVWASSLSVYPGESGSYSVGMQSAYGVFVDEDDKDYIGDYFIIEQKSFVSDGETKRHIDISSPVSGAYLMEDVNVIGMAKIQDSFSLLNYKPGLAVGTGWLVNWLEYF
jgi:hypothetical protein